MASLEPAKLHKPTQLPGATGKSFADPYLCRVSFIISEARTRDVHPLRSDVTHLSRPTTPPPTPPRTLPPCLPPCLVRFSVDQGKQRR